MKINLILLFTSLTFAANVTFNVDMALQDVGNEGPTLWMGHLYPEPGFQMEDLDGDGIWSYTIDLDEGTYTYKFRNGWWTDWNTGSGWEEVPSECEVGLYGDREIIVTEQDLNIDKNQEMETTQSAETPIALTQEEIDDLLGPEPYLGPTSWLGSKENK